MGRCTLAALLLAVILLGNFTYALQAAPALHVSGNTTSPLQISNSTHALDPAIAQTSDGKIYIVWRDDELGVYNIYSAWSADNGQNWSSPLPLASTPGNSANPSLVISDTLPRVAWSDYISGLDFKIYQADIGSGSPPLLLPNPYPRVAYYPSMAAGRDGELHMVFSGKSANEPTSILYSRRPAGASEWITPTVIHYTSNGGGLDPSLAISADGDELYVVWSQQVDVTNYYVMYMRGSIGAGGTVTWTEPTAISTPDSHIWRPKIAAAPNGDLHVVWSERTLTGIYLHYNRYTGGAWQGRVDIGGNIAYEVNQNTPFSLLPAIATSTDGNLICVVWNALPSVAAVGEDLFLTCSEDRGATWSPREQCTNSPSTISTHAAIFIDADGQIHLTWQEQTGSSATYDYQVFYARRLGHTVFMPLVLRQAR